MAKVETLEGMVSLGPFDFIIFAIGYRSNRSLVEAGDLGTPMVIVGDFRCSDVIEEIENDSGKPVVTSNQATAWHLMKMLGINDVVEGYGRLLRKTPRV
jgi:maleate cis-trans isomerase